MLDAHELIARNDCHSTYVSGSTIDVVLAPVGQRCDAQTFPETIAESDHKIVHVDTYCEYVPNTQQHIGRVNWVRDDSWAFAFETIDSINMWLAERIGNHVNTQAFHSAALGGVHSKRMRRLILDCCAFCREATYIIAGHLHKCTVAKVPRKRPLSCAPALRLASQSDIASFKHVVRKHTWEQHRLQFNVFSNSIRATRGNLRGGCPKT